MAQLNIQFFQKMKKQAVKMSEKEIILACQNEVAMNDELRITSFINLFGNFHTKMLNKEMEMKVLNLVFQEFYKQKTTNIENDLYFLSILAFQNKSILVEFSKEFCKEIEILRAKKIRSAKVGAFDDIFQNVVFEDAEKVKLLLSEADKYDYLFNGYNVLFILNSLLSLQQVETLGFAREVKENLMKAKLFKEYSYFINGIDYIGQPNANFIKTFKSPNTHSASNITKDFNQWLIETLFEKEKNLIAQAKFYFILNSPEYSNDFKQNLTNILKATTIKELNSLQQALKEKPYFEKLIAERIKQAKSVKVIIDGFNVTAQEEANTSKRLSFNVENQGDLVALELFNRGMPFALHDNTKSYLQAVKSKLSALLSLKQFDGREGAIIDTLKDIDNLLGESVKESKGSFSNRAEYFESYEALTDYAQKRRALLSPIRLLEVLPTKINEEEPKKNWNIIPYLTKEELLSYGKIFTVLFGIDMSASFIREKLYINQHYLNILDYIWEIRTETFDSNKFYFKNLIEKLKGDFNNIAMLKEKDDVLKNEAENPLVEMLYNQQVVLNACARLEQNDFELKKYIDAKEKQSKINEFFIGESGKIKLKILV